MKLLHTKSLPEPIRLVSACHNMNVFAIVTTHAVTVFRSSTLSAVCSLPLAAHAEELANDNSSSATSSTPSDLAACWSPSGRLLVLSLPRGTVLMLDVESGELARRLAPADAPQHEQQSQRWRAMALQFTHGAQFASRAASRAGSPLLAGRARSPAAAVGAATAEEKAEEAAAGEEERGPAAQALREVPLLPLSTAVARVAALSWVRLPATVTAGGARGAPLVAERGAGTCLPLPSGVSSAVLEEAERREAAAAAAAGGVSSSSARASPAETTVLLVLDALWTLSCVLGGMREVFVVRLPLSDLQLFHSGSTGVVVRQLEMRSYAAAFEGIVRECAPDAAGLLQELNPLSFFNISTQRLREDTEAAGRAGLSPVSSAVWQQEALLVLEGSQLGGTPAASAKQQTADSVVAVDLGSRLGRVCHPGVLSLCLIAEHCHTAETCLLLARRAWRRVLAEQVYTPLRLPQYAALLQDAVVDDIAAPREASLFAYFSLLKRPAVAEAHAAVHKAVRCVAADVRAVCCRYYDEALCLAQLFHPQSCTTVQLPQDDEEDAITETLTLVEVIGALRRQCGDFVRDMAAEAEEVSDLLQWALHRATLFTNGILGPIAAATGGSAQRPAATTDPALLEPLPIHQHARLLRTLRRIATGGSRTTPPPSEALLAYALQEMFQKGTEMHATRAARDVREPAAGLIVLPRDENGNDAASSSGAVVDVDPGAMAAVVESLSGGGCDAGNSPTARGSDSEDGTASEGVVERRNGSGATSLHVARLDGNAMISVRDFWLDTHRSAVLNSGNKQPAQVSVDEGEEEDEKEQAPSLECVSAGNSFDVRVPPSTQNHSDGSGALESAAASFHLKRVCRIDEDHYVLVGVRRDSVVAISVDGSGQLRSTNDDDEDDEEREVGENGGNTDPARENEEENDVGSDGSANGAGATEGAVVEVCGVPLAASGALSISISRAREFGVVAVHDKFLVLDLYDE